MPPPFVITGSPTATVFPSAPAADAHLQPASQGEDVLSTSQVPPLLSLVAVVVLGGAGALLAPRLKPSDERLPDSFEIWVSNSLTAEQIRTSGINFLAQQDPLWPTQLTGNPEVIEMEPYALLRDWYTRGFSLPEVLEEMRTFSNQWCGEYEESKPPRSESLPFTATITWIENLLSPDTCSYKSLETLLEILEILMQASEKNFPLIDYLCRRLQEAWTAIPNILKDKLYSNSKFLYLLFGFIDPYPHADEVKATNPPLPFTHLQPSYSNWSERPYVYGYQDPLITIDPATRPASTTANDYAIWTREVISHYQKDSLRVAQLTKKSRDGSEHFIGNKIKRLRERITNIYHSILLHRFEEVLEEKRSLICIELILSMMELSQETSQWEKVAEALGLPPPSFTDQAAYAASIISKIIEKDQHPALLIALLSKRPFLKKGSPLLTLLGAHLSWSPWANLPAVLAWKQQAKAQLHESNWNRLSPLYQTPQDPLPDEVTPHPKLTKEDQELLNIIIKLKNLRDQFVQSLLRGDSERLEVLKKELQTLIQSIGPIQRDRLDKVYDWLGKQNIRYIEHPGQFPETLFLDPLLLDVLLRTHNSHFSLRAGYSFFSNLSKNSTPPSAEAVIEVIFTTARALIGMSPLLSINQPQ
ncbi:MAG: hypothetical protein IPJ69_12535 [Deltaproteobacteria bacterium]|nr:MAG: hypothetical protein IPJ69_12535 [Deltaproteobacteria bacterium]